MKRRRAEAAASTTSGTSRSAADSSARARMRRRWRSTAAVAQLMRFKSWRDRRRDAGAGRRARGAAELAAFSARWLGGRARRRWGLVATCAAAWAPIAASALRRRSLQVEGDAAARTASAARGRRRDAARADAMRRPRSSAAAGVSARPALAAIAPRWAPTRRSALPRPRPLPQAARTGTALLAASRWSARGQPDRHAPGAARAGAPQDRGGQRDRFPGASGLPRHDPAGLRNGLERVAAPGHRGAARGHRGVDAGAGDRRRDAARLHGREAATRLPRAAVPAACSGSRWAITTPVAPRTGYRVQYDAVAIRTSPSTASSRS